MVMANSGGAAIGAICWCRWPRSVKNNTGCLAVRYVGLDWQRVHAQGRQEVRRQGEQQEDGHQDREQGVAENRSDPGRN